MRKVSVLIGGSTVFGLMSLLLLLQLIRPGICFSASESLIEKSFRVFAKEFMDNLRRENCRIDSKSQVESYKQGYCIRTVNYDGEWNVSLKRTDSSSTPYIGLLTYLEKHLVKYGPAANHLDDQSELMVTEVPVTEIFRYSNGGWKY